MQHDQAYTINELTEGRRRPGRTKIYQEIKEGKLRARKIGRSTVILASDWQQYLQSLPSVVPHLPVPPSGSPDGDDQTAAAEPPNRLARRGRPPRSSRRAADGEAA